MSQDSGFEPRWPRRHFIKLVGLGSAAVLAKPLLAGLPRTDREVLIFYLADTHASYSAYGRILSLLDQVIQDNPRTPVLVVINGDVFEIGDLIGQRSGGAGDWAFLAHLRSRAPVLINVGNHEFDFQGPKEWGAQARALDLAVVSNIRNSQDNQLIAPDFFEFEGFTFPGFATTALNTYVPGVRGQLVIPDPLESLGQFQKQHDVSPPKMFVLSHAGLNDDRRLLEFTGSQSLLAGAHNHQTFHYQFADRYAYFQQGFRGESVKLIHLGGVGNPSSTRFQEVIIDSSYPEEVAFAKEIAALRKDYLRAEDQESVGGMSRQLNFAEAVQWAVERIQQGTEADLALVNHTSFGSGLPEGVVSRYAFSTFVRFDNRLVEANLPGVDIKKIIEHSQQEGDTPLGRRQGAVLFTATPRTHFEDHTEYRFVTSDWVALEANQKGYLGLPHTVSFSPVAEFTVRSVLGAALASH